MCGRSGGRARAGVPASATACAGTPKAVCECWRCAERALAQCSHGLTLHRVSLSSCARALCVCAGTNAGRH
eukprot:12300251-Alexandrium_andersonii.AAC.1